MAHAITNEQAREFEREVMPHVDVAYRMARSLTRDEDQAQDLVQDAALRAMRAFPRLEHRDNLRSWLARIVHTTFLDRVRYEQRRPTQSIDAEDGIDESALGVTELEPSVFEQCLDDDYQACMDALPSTWRATIQLVDIEGISYEDAAVALDVPIGTVRSRLHRARLRLYEELCRRLKLGYCSDSSKNPTEGRG